jgi:hypothetical protein
VCIPVSTRRRSAVSTFYQLEGFGKVLNAMLQVSVSNASTSVIIQGEGSLVQFRLFGFSVSDIKYRQTSVIKGRRRIFEEYACVCVCVCVCVCFRGIAKEYL